MQKSLFALVFIPALALAAGATLEERARSLFKPISPSSVPAGDPVAAANIELGKMLFFDARLSRNQNVSCNSCHDLAKYGVDGAALSTGHKNQKGGRNSPTVMNAALHVAQFWDGRAATLEDQAKGPVVNPVEMAMTDGAAVETVLRSIPGYASLFQKAFPGEKQPITFDNFARALGAFERTLSTPSRFDAWLAGDSKALTDAEKAGLETFIATGCIACHNGAGLGGSMYQRFGLVAPVPGLKDPGRFEVTKNEADRFFFKVPSLRNIEKTAPYFHNAGSPMLESAIAMMAKYQVGRELEVAEITSIATFLKSLTGELPRAALTKPVLPPSGPTTPPPIAD